ncbi:MAG: (d)CMP kinase [Buchnera aphidicola (Periphyllus lyropictus)]|uniref:(d)CMP kinase n=1 Tax=Buchnera aphidicola TaxID=9 RepID=UPI001EC9E7DA|nr:(d)CMP kinase [Buchnera aphidicola]NIH16824.1 (d)CMP kinase [Buchnera aphidicola (Periphyllus lyropictus)]USS94506.1 (d)CMP kinase [Buchnera aphidicola (Periphyllus lyropictus)]
MIKKSPVVTIDGPSGVGKSTLSQKISKKLKWNILESGYMYRVIAFYIIKKKLSIKEKEIIPILNKINFNFKYEEKKFIVILNGKDISNDISSQKVSMVASKIAIFPYIRYWLLFYQRKFRKFPGLIANGRDMGTVVFPDAILKIFLKTKFIERVNRRILDFKRRGFNVNRDIILKEMKKRDLKDKNRIICPLRPDKNAIIIDSTHMTFKETLNYIIKFIKKKIVI